jgi:hypothetical protein
VLQDDIFFPNLTVRDTISYTAYLKLPKSLSWKEKREKVDEILTELGIQRCSNTIVGGGWVVRHTHHSTLVTRRSLFFFFLYFVFFFFFVCSPFLLCWLALSGVSAVKPAKSVPRLIVYWWSHGCVSCHHFPFLSRD